MITYLVQPVLRDDKRANVPQVPHTVIEGVEVNNPTPPVVRVVGFEKLHKNRSLVHCHPDAQPPLHKAVELGQVDVPVLVAVQLIEQLTAPHEGRVPGDHI